MIRVFMIVSLVLFIFSCSCHKSTLKDTLNTASLVMWEPEPRLIGPGRDAQILVRASEAIYLVRAIPAGNGGLDLLFSVSHNEGDTFSNPIRVNPIPGEASSHGENGLQLRQGPGKQIYVAWEAKSYIRFARCVNFGRSFMPAITVNDDTDDASQSFFTMEVALPTGLYV